MANDVVLSAASRSNLLSLQSTQKMIDSTQLRLATGKKVNSALDNPQSFFQSQSLSNRASDLTRLLDGIGQSIRTIEGADKGITALSNLVTQASSVADEAMSEMLAASGIASITSGKDLRGVADILGSSNGAITATTNTFAIKVVDSDITGGSATSANIAVAAGENVYNIAAKINADVTVRNYVSASVDDQGRLKITSKEDGAAIRISGGTANALSAAGMAALGLEGSVKTENGGTATTFRQGGTIIAGRTLESRAALDATKVNGAFEASATLTAAGFVTTGTVNISMTIDGNAVALGGFATTTTIQDVVDAVNNSGNKDVTASFNTTTGKIELAFGNKVGEVSLSMNATAAANATFGFGTGGTDGSGLGAFAANTTFSENFRLTGSSANLDQYTKDYNKLREQIDGIVKDANYRGVNLLAGDNLTTFFNEDRSSTLTTTGVDFSAEGLGVSKANFTDAASIEKSISEARNALSSIRAFGTSIANDLSIMQARQTFTTETINTLKAGAADLVNADLNEEGANLLALQTAQQLGVTSLSLASQSQQSVLRLF